MVQTLKTRSESALQAKMKKQGGFTLAELLIVVAIIAILAAIAIPVYSAQMENARQRVDESALSSATSMASTDYLINNETAASVDYKVWQSTTVGDAGNRNIMISKAGVVTLSGAEEYKFQSKDYTTMTIKIGPGGAIIESKIS